MFLLWTRETYTHLYWSCPLIAEVITRFRQYCTEHLDYHPVWFNRNAFLFSVYPAPQLVAMMTILKKYIFVCRLNRECPNFRAFMCTLRSYIKQEKFSATYSKRLEQYHKFWGILTNDEVLDEFDFL